MSTIITEQLKEMNSEESPDDIYPEVFTSLNDSVVNSMLVLSDKLIIDMARKGDDEETKSNGKYESADAGVSINNPTTIAV